jgi:hypothetical protein
MFLQVGACLIGIPVSDQGNNCCAANHQVPIEADEALAYRLSYQSCPDGHVTCQKADFQ